MWFFLHSFFLRQRDLYRRFKLRYSTNSNSGNESSVRSDTSELPAVSSIFIPCADKSATVDANNSINPAAETVQRSDSAEGDFEIISKEQFYEMADTPNGVENAEAQREDAEANDKFPQKMDTKNANWNTMELGEKRKRLR